MSRRARLNVVVDIEGPGWVIKANRPSRWAYRFPGGNTFYYTDRVPNAFHRLMQRLLLGIVWGRL